jgi:hypothetical protein
MDSPYGYWYMALEEVARTLNAADPTAITETKAIRKAVLAPDEAVIAYITTGDYEQVVLYVLTNYRRVARIAFTGNSVHHVSIPLTNVIFEGGTLEGSTSRMTDVAGFDAVTFRFVLHAPERVELTLPMSVPHSVAGREEIEFAQKLMGALYGEAAR